MASCSDATFGFIFLGQEFGGAMRVVMEYLRAAWLSHLSSLAGLAAAGLVAAGYVALAVYGGWINYSIVPYLDTYDVLPIIFGGASSLAGWFALHNEHRILATKALLWVDYVLFQGAGVFLIVMNFVLMAFIAGGFFFFLRKAGGWGRANLPLYILLSVLPAFSFIQKENIVWEFQSQFFLVSLLPMASCALLLSFLERREVRANRVFGYLLSSALLAVLSVLNMGNGILFFGVYIVVLWAFRIIGGLGLAGCCLAALVYQLHSGTGSTNVHAMLEAFSAKTAKFLFYVPSALGNFSEKTLGQTGATIMGTCLLACCIYLVFAAARAIAKNRRRKNVTVLAAALAAYVCLSVLAATVARIDLADPFVSRYSTLSLMVFVMCLVGVLSCLESDRARRTLLAGAALVSLGLLGPWQLTVLQDMRPMDRLVAGLCYAYGIDDAEMRGIPHFNASKLEVAVALMKREKTGFVAAHPYALAEISTEAWTVPPGFVQIAGRIDAVKPVGSQGRYAFVTGWALEYKRKRVPPYVYIADGEKRVVGFAVVGAWRQELASPLGREAELSGLAGYVQRTALTKTDNLQFYCPAAGL
ncbi:hypothetical membrane protein [Solidesulfovibrio magneticus RS-1]|uniref:Hypothetical membrane protein n=2 Tax=Solidesulfovibrio TaxID=2910984 RepID=C4XP53_SOLM1|nr:hypothetical membrane protein [Solidesulfovibrio magneticus RS-1]